MFLLEDLCNCYFLLAGLPRNQPGPDQHWLAAPGLPSSYRRGPASVSGPWLTLMWSHTDPSVQDVHGDQTEPGGPVLSLGQ